MTSDLSHLNNSHRFGMWQLLGMLMCIFQNSKSIGHHCVHAAVSQDEWLEWSRGAMKWNEECCMLWCDKFTGIRDSQWTASEICCPPNAWDSGTVLRNLSFSSFISPQSASLSASVLHPNSDTVRTPTQTSTLHESIGMGPLPGINTSFFSLWLCICHYFAVSHSCLLPSGYILFGWPVKVTIYCVSLLTAWK